MQTDDLHFTSKSIDPEMNTVVSEQDSAHPTANVLCLFALVASWVALMIYICVVIIIYHYPSE